MPARLRMTTRMKTEILEPLPVVVCVVGERQYAIPVTEIVEITALMKITAIPEAPQEMLGVVNRHGSVVPIIDLRLCFGQNIGALDLSTLFVVVQGPNYAAGLVVDGVLGVVTLPPSTVGHGTQSGPYVRGLATYEQMPLLILDISVLLKAFDTATLAVEE